MQARVYNILEDREAQKSGKANIRKDIISKGMFSHERGVPRLSARK